MLNITQYKKIYCDLFCCYITMLYIYIVIIKQQVIIEPAATDKRRKTMKTKIQFTDSYSGRAINIVINLTDGEKEYYLREDDKNVIYNKMSSYQRAKIESFFGKMNAYYTKIEIL